MSKSIILELSENNENQLIANLFKKDGNFEEPLNNENTLIPSINSIFLALESWRGYYLQFAGVRTLGEDDDDDDEDDGIQQSTIPVVNQLVVSCNQTGIEITQLLNQWLNSNEFVTFREQIEQQLEDSDSVEVLIRTNNRELWRLPWHLWDAFQGAEVALSYTESRQIKRPTIYRQKVKILAVLGDSEGINIDKDLEFLKNLSDADVTPLVNPTRKQLYEQLYNPQGWDILFFAGHSNTETDFTGKIYINDRKDCMSIGELKTALSTSINLGLKLAIFNSCDGLGLASELAELFIPQLIVMREVVPDAVAQEFLKTFLKAYSQGETLHNAVKIARKELEKLEETQYPCASWLPIICKNSADTSPKWLDFLGENQDITWQGSLRAMLEIATINRLRKNFLVRDEKIGFETQEIYIPLGLVSKQKPIKSEEEKKNSDSPEDAENNQQSEQNAEEISKTYARQELFFKEVLTEEKSPTSQGKRLMIIGEGGAGKSTFLRKIANWVFEKFDQMAIWVSLADLGDLTSEKVDGLALEKYLQKWFEKNKETIRFPAENFEDLKELFQTGKVWLLLDAVDEMRTTNNGLFVLSKLLTDWMKQGRIVITCRLNVWEAGKQFVNDFDTYRLSELNYNRNSEDDQVGQFIERYFLRYRRRDNQNEQEVTKTAERLRNQLNESGRRKIKELVRNPLRLTLLCAAYDVLATDEELPKTKAGLYEKFTESVYRWYNYKRQAEQQNQTQETLQSVSPEQQRELNSALARLALRGIEENLFELPHNIVEAELGELLEKALEVGWLNQVGVSNDEKIYTFYHRSFQDYFAALAIDDGRFFLNHDNGNENKKPNPLLNPNPALALEYNNGKPSYRLLDPQAQWREVYMLWLGRNDVEDSEEERFKDNKFSVLVSLWTFRDGCQETYNSQTQYLCALGWGEFISAHIFPITHNEKLNKEELNKVIDFITQQFVIYKFGFFDKEKNGWMQLIEPLKEVATLALKEIDMQVVIKTLMEKIEERIEHSRHFLDVIHFISDIDPNFENIPEEYSTKIINHLIDILEEPDNEYGLIRNIIEYLQKLNPQGNLLTERVVNGLLTSLDNYKHNSRNFWWFGYGDENYLQAVFSHQENFRQRILNRLTDILLDPQLLEENILDLPHFLWENAKANSLVISKLLNWFLNYWQNFQEPDYNLSQSKSSAEKKEKYRLERLESQIFDTLQYTAQNHKETIEQLIEATKSNSYCLRAKYKLFDLLFFIGRTNDQFKQFLLNFLGNDNIDNDLYKSVLYDLSKLVKSSAKQKEKGKSEYLSEEEKQQIINLLLERLKQENLANDIKTEIIETLPVINPNDQSVSDNLINLLQRYNFKETDSEIETTEEENIDWDTPLYNYDAQNDSVKSILNSVIESLKKMVISEQQQINILVSEFLKPNHESYSDGYFRSELSEIVAKQSVSNQEAINVLINQLLKPDLDDSINRSDIRDILSKIAVDNEEAINTLINQLTRYKYKSYSSYSSSYTLDEQIDDEIIIILRKIIKTNDNSINQLAEILARSDIEGYLKERIKGIIEGIQEGKEKAVKHLISLVPELNINE